MDNKELATHAFENTWRLESILHLATMADESSVGILEDALEFEFDLDLAKRIGLPEESVEEEWSVEEILEWLRDHDKLGWLVQAATPIHEYFKEGCSTFSWSRYTSQWLYADTYEEVIEQVKAWVEQKDQEAKAAFKGVQHEAD